MQCLVKFQKGVLEQLVAVSGVLLKFSLNLFKQHYRLDAHDGNLLYRADRAASVLDYHKPADVHNPLVVRLAGMDVDVTSCLKADFPRCIDRRFGAVLPRQ